MIGGKHSADCCVHLELWQLSVVRLSQEAKLPPSHRAHGFSGIVDPSATIETYLVGLAIEGERTGQFVMAAAKADFNKEIKKLMKKAHRSALSFQVVDC